MASTAVRVALRVRPLTEKELINNCTECLTFIPNEPQILIGTDKSFTYDYVFDTNTDQAKVYSDAASPLLRKFVDGFNATILAYGQTGSGKTFSMGTSLDNNVSAENEGIVPRCIVELFQILKEREAQDEEYKFEVYVSFLELYNEDFIDLLNIPHQSKRKSQNYNQPTEVSIREDIAGNIYWSGVKEEICYGPEEILGHLAQGSLNRTTGSTEMNSVSSRSHAIFSVILKQQQPEMEDGKKVVKSLQSKFHFVDLAGSERLKRTHAQGDRAKEGIAINSGLLALGNVISALGDEARRATHIPYRDSKLTRLLQDSLGGNSQTMMLACVSPADTNFMETLNTLKYANRARNIKNRVVVNQDFAGSSMEVNQLKALVSRLRMEIASLRAGGHSSTTNTFTMPDDNTALKNESNRLHEQLQDLSNQLIQVTSERDTLVIERELGEFMQNDGDDDDFLENIGSAKKIQTHPIIEGYLKQIQELTLNLNTTNEKLQSSEALQSSLKKTIEFQQQQLAFQQKQQQQQQQQQQINNSVLQRFSSTAQPKSNNSNRRRRFGGRISANSSATTNGYAARITTKILSARRPVITKSTSTSTRTNKRKHVRIKKSPQQKIYYDKNDEYEDEGYVNDLQEDDVRHEEVKESIAKVRADIRKSLQVLELVKPLDDTTSAWEEELKAFEVEEKLLQQTNEMQRTPSDEGRFSLTSSPIDEFTQDIESMSVPNWENDEHLTRDLQSDSKSNTTYEDMMESKLGFSSRHSGDQTKYNTQLYRMLHQIQSDIKVKEELVSHLEKSETEFTFMRKKFDEKINHLQAQLVETQKEKDTALMKSKSGIPAKSDTHHQQASRANAMIDKQNAEIRHAYETKMKNLMTEIQDLKRKYAHTTMTMQSTRNQNESLLRSLKSNVDTLKVEKKRLIHRMKLEAERVREQLSKQEKKIQQLQRQHAKSNQVKRRLERENEQQKTVLKKRNEEVMINSNQVKQLTSIMKKAVREGGILDERMLSKLTPILGGHFAVIARGGGHGFPKRNIKKKNPIPLETRVSRKKELLDKALNQYIQGKQAVVEMEQLLIRRQRLAEEKLELEEEREQVYYVEKEHEETTGQPMDTIAIELMDERIDLITAEISYLSARIRTLQTEAAAESLEAEENCINGKTSSPKPTKHVTFVDEILTEPFQNDEWADVDAFEEQYSVPTNAAPEIAYEITSKLIKSFETDECRRIIENLIDDIMDLRMNECNRQATVQNLEQTVIELRRTMISLKKSSVSNSSDAERRIRQLGISDNDMIDMMMQEEENHNTMNDYISHADLHSTNRHDSMSLYQSENKHQQISLPNSPVASPPFITNSYSTIAGSSSNVNKNNYNNTKNSNSFNKPPMPRMVESISKSTSMLNRESTPSPDRFYNMVQKRLSWQQHLDKEESRLDDPIDFEEYNSEHESSTSSIRSNHLRRSSVQSDVQSESYWNQKSLVRDNNNMMINDSNVRPTMSSFLSHINPNNLMLSSDLNEYDNYHIQQISSSMQPPRIIRRPLPPLMPSVSTFERPMTPTVFDRLAQTPTRSSRAKVNHRHSSGSVDELRRRWELEQRPSSAMSENYS